MTLRAMLAAWILRPKCRALRRRVYYFSFMNRIQARKQSHAVARFDRDQQSCREDEDGGGGALPYKPIRDVPFFRVSVFQHKFITRYEN